MTADEVRKTIVTEALIPPGGHVVVGFSGGPDSSCLFDVLLSLRDALDFSLSAVHVNHGLRGDEADADERYVREVCAARGIPLLVRRVDVAGLARARDLSVEEAGRDARYAAYEEAARAAEQEYALAPDLVRIALAHNRGDLSETVLMRILRGTGPDGLAAIEAARTPAAVSAAAHDDPVRRAADVRHWIIRPLLRTDRADIEAYCAERGLNPRTDRTNMETDYLRNSIRLELLPLLRGKYNPSVDDALARLATAAAESRDYFDGVVDAIPAEVRGAGSPATCGGATEISLELLTDLHPAIRHRLIVRVFSELGLAQDIGAAHLAAADRLIGNGRTGRTVDFPAGYRFGIEYDKAVFTAPDGLATVESAPVTRTIESRAALEDIARAESPVVIFEDSPLPIVAEVVAAQPPDTAAFALTFDYDALAAAARTLILRPRQPGDRIALPGMDGTKKLQDVFTDAKVPRAERDAVLLLATESEILWIPALRHTRRYAPTPQTVRVLTLIPRGG
jgi:tRNA(Ile)-lysidine synthase